MKNFLYILGVIVLAGLIWFVVSGDKQEFAENNINSETKDLVLNTIDEERLNTEDSTISTNENQKLNRYEVDSSSKVTFDAGKKFVNARHQGIFKVSDGFVTIEDNLLTGGEVVVDIGSLEIINTPNPAPVLADILSNNFLSSNIFSEAKFTINNIQIIEDGNPVVYKIYGVLDLHGVKKDIEVELEDSWTSLMHNFTGGFILNRTLFDITYQSGSFFENLGEKTIDDDVIIEFDLVFEKN